MKDRAPVILITGFEPFGGVAVNPSALVAQRLHGRRIDDCRVSGLVLPCVFGGALRRLKEALLQENPRLVICLGLAEERAAIMPERIAINVMDARIPDNAGRQPVDVPVVEKGPPAYWSTLPVKAIVEALAAKGIPAAVSQSAGTYVCNQVFYGLMHALRRRPGMRGGFIHLPLLPEQAADGRPGLPLDSMTEAIALAAEVTLKGGQL